LVVLATMWQRSTSTMLANCRSPTDS
jgi:hypothetical protein